MRYAALFFILISSFIAASNVSASACSTNGGACTSNCDLSRGDVVMQYSCSVGGSPIFRKVVLPNEAMVENDGDTQKIGDALVSESKATSTSPSEESIATAIPAEDNPLTQTVCCRINHAPTVNLPDHDVLNNWEYGPYDLRNYSDDPDLNDLSFQVTHEEILQVDCEIDGQFLLIHPAPGYVGPASCTILASDGHLNAQDTMNFQVYDSIAGNGAPNQIISSTGTDISITSAVGAVCRYSVNADAIFDQMTPFQSIDGLSHIAGISGLANGFTTIYARCVNTSIFKDEESYSWRFWDDLLPPAQPINISPKNGSTYFPVFWSILNGSAYPVWAIFSEPDIQKVQFDWYWCGHLNPGCLYETINVTNTTFAENKSFGFFLDTTIFGDDWLYELNITAFDYGNHSQNAFLVNLDIDNSWPTIVWNFNVTRGAFNNELMLSFIEPGDNNAGPPWYEAWCRNLTHYTGCPVGERIIKYSTNPIETEEDFWNAPNLSTWSGGFRNVNGDSCANGECFLPQACNKTTQIMMKNVPQDVEYYFSILPIDKVGHRNSWNMSRIWSTKHNHAHYVNQKIDIVNVTCIKYDSYGAPHWCNTSWINRLNLLDPTDIAIYENDPLVITAWINNSGTEDLNVSTSIYYPNYQGNVMSANSNYSTIFMKNGTLANITINWGPDLYYEERLNPYMKLAINYTNQTFLINYTNQTNDIWKNVTFFPGTGLHNYIVYSLQEIAHLRWSLTELPNETVEQGKNVSVHIQFYLSEPFGTDTVFFKEVPFRLYVNGSYYVDSILFWDHCINANTSCYQNLTTYINEPSNWPHAKWRLNGLAPGIYNITVQMGNDGDDVNVSTLLTVMPSGMTGLPGPTSQRKTSS